MVPFAVNGESFFKVLFINLYIYIPYKNPMSGIPKKIKSFGSKISS